MWTHFEGMVTWLAVVAVTQLYAFIKNIELFARECISKYRLGKPLKKAQQNKQTNKNS